MLPVAVVLVSVYAHVAAYDILFVPMHLTGSHKKSMVPLANYMAAKGHNVTMWYAFFEKVPINSKQVKDINIVLDTQNQLYLEQFVWKNGSTLMDAWNSGDVKPWNMIMPWLVNVDICKHVVTQRMDAINEITSQKWDLIIVDLFFAPCGYMITEKANVSHALMSTSLILPASSRHLTQPMQIASALYNTVNFDPRRFSSRAWYVIVWEIMDIIANEFINQAMKWSLSNHLPRRFSYASFDAKSDLCIILYPDLFEPPKPSILGILQAGDMACKSVKPMPDEYAKFVNDPASKGTLLAAFGHIVSWASTKNETIYAIYEAFKRLKDYRIIWQYNGVPLPPLPNVKTSGWIPQNEILLDKKTKAFISHMGLKSAMEGLCAKVPFVALPIYAEQALNTQLLIGRHNLGSYLNKWRLSADDIVQKILDVTENETYQQRVAKFAQLMTDRPIPAQNLTAFWVEFVIRHQNHLEIIRHRGRYLSFIKRWMIDVVSVAGCALAAVTYIVVTLGSRAAKSLSGAVQ